MISTALSTLRCGGMTGILGSSSTTLASLIVGALLVFSSFGTVHGVDDGRLCCRYRGKSFKPTGITYIPTLDSLLAVDRLGNTQFVNLTDSKCGAHYCGDSARWTPKDERRLTDETGAPIIFDGATTKDDAHLAYLLEGGRSTTGPPKIHFFDLDSWTIFHTVALPEMNVTDTKGAGSLAWIPDGHADGRFLVGSHIDGTVYAYRVSSDTSFSTAKLIDTFKLSGLPPEAVDLSGMAFDFDARKLFTLFHKGHWSMHAHHVMDDGTVASNLGSRWLAGKTTIGGSPPFKHEGIAVYRDRFEGSYHNFFIADAHRYIYNIRWRIGSSRLVRCPWVYRRVIGCCFTDQPCQNMATEDCQASGGFYVGKQCDVNTCANTAFDSEIFPETFQLGCPNSTYFNDAGGDCHLCDNTNRGGKPGCNECQNSLDPQDDDNQLLCTSCDEGYYLDDATCKPCTDTIASCSSCGLDASSSFQCYECSEGSVLIGNECIPCSSDTPNCSRCMPGATEGSITCEDCDNPFYLSNAEGGCKSCASPVDGEGINFCEQCHESLFGVVTCEICAEGYSLFQNECVADCPLGYYATEYNRGQEIEPGSGCGSPRGPGLDPVWVCRQCEADNYNAECSAVPPVPTRNNCTDLDWPSNLSGEDNSVCSGAIVNNRCLDGTLSQAQSLCGALGARLCTRGELLRGEGLLSGCGEHDRVWTSSRNDGCGGWYSITTARSGDTLIEDSLCTRHNMGETNGVQCCADGDNIADTSELSSYPKSNELYDMGNGHATCWLLDWDSKIGSTQTCARSQINGVCYDNVTWTEAEEVCASVGSHVCRMEELSHDTALDTTDTGCGLDNAWVWSNATDNCPDNHHLVAGGSDYAQNTLFMRPQCVPDTGRAPVRCCTYASVEGQAQLWDLIDQCVFGMIVAVWGAILCVTETHTPGGSCYGQRPYNEAQDVCDMQSARLCTSAEISAMSYLNNCGFLEEKVWTLDDHIVAEDIEYCPINHHVTRAGSDTYLWKHPEECSEVDGTLANVMCCTGPIPVDPCLDVTCPISTNDCTSEARCISTGINPGDYSCIEVDVSGFYSDIWTCGDAGTCTGQLGVCDASADPCETISCFQESECREVGVCEDGFCTSPFKTEGAVCDGGQGICTEGECITNGNTSNSPSVASSAAPSAMTSAPTRSPTTKPSASPSLSPSKSPSSSSLSPSKSPTRIPTTKPSSSPSLSPSKSPTRIPTTKPSSSPSLSPSKSPSSSSLPPSESPTRIPTTKPSSSPSLLPSKSPTRFPTTKPSSSQSSTSPSSLPTKAPTNEPSPSPSTSPSKSPSTTPSKQPTDEPTTAPTNEPSSSPSKSPSVQPSSAPIRSPTTSPSNSPVRPVSNIIVKFACSKNPVDICAVGDPIVGSGSVCLNGVGTVCGNGGKVCQLEECPDTGGPTPPSPPSPSPPAPTTPTCTAAGDDCTSKNCNDCCSGSGGGRPKKCD